MTPATRRFVLLVLGVCTTGGGPLVFSAEDETPSFADFLRQVERREAAVANAVVEAVDVVAFEEAGLKAHINVLRVSFELPGEKWVRRQVSADQKLALELIAEGTAFPAAFAARIESEANPAAVVVSNGGRMLYMYPGLPGIPPPRWDGQIKGAFDSFERRGALNGALLLRERPWSETVSGLSALAMRKDAGDGLLWLLKEAPAPSKDVRVHRFVTGPAPNLVLREHTETVVGEAGLPGVLAAWGGDPTALSQEERLVQRTRILATVEFAGVTLPACHEWRPSHATARSNRTWLRYRNLPKVVDGGPSSFDVLTVPEECRGSKIEVLDELARVTLTSSPGHRLIRQIVDQNQEHLTDHDHLNDHGHGQDGAGRLWWVAALGLFVGIGGTIIVSRRRNAGRRAG